MKLGYLGPEGTYTEQATQQTIGDLGLSDVETLPMSPIPALFEALHRGAIEMAVVPRRNSLAGDYTETVRGLGQYDFRQVHEVVLQIRLAIGVHREARDEEIAEIWSKDTALKECSRYLDVHFPLARRTEVESTAYAMQQVADRGLRNVAAVGSRLGLQRYGLRVVHDDIGNERENYTTFLVLERQGVR